MTRKFFDIFQTSKGKMIGISIVLILMGILAILIPSLLMKSISIIVGTITVAFGIYQIVDSILKRYILVNPSTKTIIGVALVILGTVFLVRWNTPYNIFLFAFGFLALLIGAFRINAAIQARMLGERCVWLFIDSFISIAFGFMLLIAPITSAILLIQILGGYWLYLGIIILINALIRNRTEIL